MKIHIPANQIDKPARSKQVGVHQLGPLSLLWRPENIDGTQLNIRRGDDAMKVVASLPFGQRNKSHVSQPRRLETMYQVHHSWHAILVQQVSELSSRRP